MYDDMLCCFTWSLPFIFQVDSTNANAVEDGEDTPSGRLMDVDEVSTDDASYMYM